MVEPGPGFIRIRAVEQSIALRGPGDHRFLNPQARFRRAIGLGAIECDPQIVTQIFLDVDNARVELRPGVRVLREQTAREGGLDRIEISGSSPRIIDGHERFVEGLRHKLAFAAQIVHRKNAERAGHHGHDQEGNEDAPADRAQKRKANQAPRSHRLTGMDVLGFHHGGSRTIGTMQVRS